MDDYQAKLQQVRDLAGQLARLREQAAAAKAADDLKAAVLLQADGFDVLAEMDRLIDEVTQPNPDLPAALQQELARIRRDVNRGLRRAAHWKTIQEARVLGPQGRAALRRMAAQGRANIEAKVQRLLEGSPEK